MVLISKRTIVDEWCDGSWAEAVFNESVALQAAIVGQLPTAPASTVRVGLARHTLAPISLTVSATWLALGLGRLCIVRSRHCQLSNWQLGL